MLGKKTRGAAEKKKNVWSKRTEIASDTSSKHQDRN